MIFINTNIGSPCRSYVLIISYNRFYGSSSDQWHFPGLKVVCDSVEKMLSHITVFSHYYLSGWNVSELTGITLLAMVWNKWSIPLFYHVWTTGIPSVIVSLIILVSIYSAYKSQYLSNTLWNTSVYNNPHCLLGWHLTDFRTMWIIYIALHWTHPRYLKVKLISNNNRTVRNNSKLIIFKTSTECVGNPTSITMLSVS